VRLLHADGSEVKTGDIVWYGRKSCIFLSFDGSLVSAETTCDRRYFTRAAPEHFNLTLEE